MANHSSNPSHRKKDLVAEEILATLYDCSELEFKCLVRIVLEKLIARNYAGGMEELVRLRIYERLQSLVIKGTVSKKINDGIKIYRLVS